MQTPALALSGTSRHLQLDKVSRLARQISCPWHESCLHRSSSGVRSSHASGRAPQWFPGDRSYMRRQMIFCLYTGLQSHSPQMAEQPLGPPASAQQASASTAETPLPPHLTCQSCALPCLPLRCCCASRLSLFACFVCPGHNYLHSFDSVWWQQAVHSGHTVTADVSQQVCPTPAVSCSATGLSQDAI